MLHALLRWSVFLIFMQGISVSAVRAQDAVTHSPGSAAPLAKRLPGDLRSRFLPPLPFAVAPFHSAGGDVINGRAMAINDHGQVTGSVWVGEGRWRGVLWHRGTSIDLGDLGTSGDVVPLDINERGDIVGMAGDFHAFLWRDGTMIDLGPMDFDLLHDPPVYVRMAINNRGQIIITRGTQPQTACAYLWDKGRFIDLGSLGGALTYAFDLNDHGQVVGFSTTANSETHLFLWERGVMKDLGEGGASQFPRVFVNARGQVAYSDDVKGDGQMVLWTRGRTEVLPGVGGPISITGINHRGQIIGTGRHALLWDRCGVAHDLDPGGSGFSEAVGINDAGDVAVRHIGDTVRGYLWRDGQLTPLGGLGGDFTWVQAINQRGQIIGVSATPDALRPFLWKNGVMIDLVASTAPSPAAAGGATGGKGNRLDVLTAGEPEVEEGRLSLVNPSRGSAELIVRVPSGNHWKLELFDVQGRQVERLGTGIGSGGAHTLRWDGTSRTGARALPGVYLARLTFGSREITRRLLWLGN